MKHTLGTLYHASIYFPRTARGHGTRHKYGCVCKDCGTHNPHIAQVPSSKSPIFGPLAGREANAFLHAEGNR